MHVEGGGGGVVLAGYLLLRWGGRGKGLCWVVMMNIPLVPQVRLLNSLNHPHIVRFYGIVIDKPIYVAGDTFVVTGMAISCLRQF